MKRIVLIVTAVAGLFAAGITTVASAATTKHVTKYVTVTQTKLARETKTVTARSTCKLSLATVAPPGQPVNLPGSQSGVQWGDTNCSGLKSGATRDTFTVADSGNLSGNIQHWFRGGTVYGTYALTPGSAGGPPTATSFGAASFTGTVKLTAGQGALSGATGTGTLSCSTPDGTHFNCTEKLKLTQTVTTLVPVTTTVREKVTV